MLLLLLSCGPDPWWVTEPRAVTLVAPLARLESMLQ